MLVLTRKEDESIIIQNNIKVVILNITSNTVKIGFECDKNIPILREEVYLAIVEHNRMAQNMNRNDYEGVKVLWKKTKKA